MSNSSNQFSELTDTIVSLTLPVTLPWLAPKESSLKEDERLCDRNADEAKEKVSLSPLLTGHIAMSEREKGGGKVGVVYSPLQVKKTKIVPNSKKRKRVQA